MVNLALLDQSGAPQFAFSYDDYEQYRDSARSVSGLVAYRMEHFTLSQAGEAISQRASTAETSLGKPGLLSPRAANAELATTTGIWIKRSFARHPRRDRRDRISDTDSNPGFSPFGASFG